jgi:23S rRNA pseudouridine1911/1915/1917 synthase
MRIKIGEAEENIRLDRIIAKRLERYSRSSVQKLFKVKKIKVGSQPGEVKPSLKLKKGKVVTIDTSGLEKVPPKLKMSIIYEDKDCVVIDKPAGILSHAKGSVIEEATVASWLEPKLDGLSGNRAGIVHRLDRNTSGVMICAKNQQSLVWLQKQFSARKVKKIYRAVIIGRPEHDEAVIDMPIERNPKKPSTFRVGVNGKKAISEYKILKKSEHFSLVELKPQTGRTNQLRVHLKAINHPVLGDSVYGGPPADRLFLHALSLEITLPNRQRRVFEAKLPPAFNNVIKNDA